MKFSRLLRTASFLAIASGTIGLLADDDAPKSNPPATAPAAPSTSPATAALSPEAKGLIDEVSAAYGKLKSLDLAGTLSSSIQASGQDRKNAQTFTASYEAPNKFRHEMKDEVLVGSTGEKAYSYLVKRNSYTAAVAFKDKSAVKDLPQPLPRVIAMQNPSLMLAICKDPAAELIDEVADVAKPADTVLGDASCPTLRLTMKNKVVMTLLFDPATHLLRKSEMDVRAILEQQGAPDVKEALLTVDYTTVTPDAPVKDEQFAWTAPAGARDAAAMAAAQHEDSPATALEGSPAPDFKLQGLDGKAVALADLKGSVAIVDFWATWCGPCRQSLPHLNKVYDTLKGDGLKVYAVDLREEKDQVQAFVDKTKLTVPVLLDTTGDVAQAYKAEGIPETVVIGKDGKVKKVFVGYGPETEEQLTKVVTEALKE